MIGRILVAPIRFYQRWISPMSPPRCRFYPSCSSYAVQAVEVHGPVRGLWMAVRRLLRCHPWNPGGVDLVPPREGRSGGADGGTTTRTTSPTAPTAAPIA